MNAALPFLFALYPFCLSGVALAWLHSAQKPTRLRWATHVLVCGSIIVFVFLAGPWAFTSYYLRYVVLGLYLLVVISSHRRMRRMERRPAARKAPRPVFSVAILILFSVLNAFVIGGHKPSGESLDLSFPLNGGTYYVLQGGNNAITNPFHALWGSKFAIDIAKLNVFGNRAHGIAPRELSAYEIFGEMVHSPCGGSVLSVRDTLPDNPPGQIDTERPAGNHIVLECADARVMMAHLRQGSIRVAPGEAVTTGQPLGQVGNSGNTMEPHLHIGARKGETDIPLRFDGRFLSINDLIRRGAMAPDTTLQPTSALMRRTRGVGFDRFTGSRFL